MADPYQALRDLDRIDCAESLSAFTRMAWPILDPAHPFVGGWVLDAICEHLMAVTTGQIHRLLINVPPGSTKSSLCDVFWPAWEWGPRNLPAMRYLAASYSGALTMRDNGRFSRLLLWDWYQERWGDRFAVTHTGAVKVQNNHTGWKLATSVGGVGTGERGDRIVIDDPNNVKEAESDTIREATNTWFRESMPDRMNDLETGAIVVIQQRTHDKDVSGNIIEDGLDYVHLCIPAEYDPGRHCVTVLGREDPRTEEGELFWPERFSAKVLARMQLEKGPYAYAGQYQQSPVPRGGGIVKREWWQLWPGPGYEQYEPQIDENGTQTRPMMFPDFEFLLGSVDGAFTEEEENDPCAMTIWGVWRDRHRLPRVMLVEAWAMHLEFHQFVTKVLATSRKRQIDALLIENKASGRSAYQEVRRLMREGERQVYLSDPKRQDKAARMHATVPFFASKMIYAPARKWADAVIAECEVVPKGAHDDLADTTSQALIWLRDRGLIQLPKEATAEDLQSMMFKSEPEPLYDV